MPEASDFISDAIHAAWNLATPANCSRDDCPISHGSSEENSQLVDNVMGLENDFLPRHSTPSRHAGAWNFFRASPQFIYPPYTTSLPVPSHQTLAAPSQSVDKMVSGRSERTTLDEVSPRLEKPPYTYNAMMVMAIHPSKEKQLSFSQIQESLVKMFPFFGGPYKVWKRSLRKALHSSKCFIMSNDKMAWSIGYDNVPYAMFKKQSKQDNDKYMRFLHEQLNVAPVVPERKFRGEPLSLPSRTCFQPQDEDDFLGARKDCVQTPSLPSIGTFVEAGSSGQNRKRTWIKTEDSTLMSVKRTCAEEPTVNNVTDTSPSSLKADKVTNDPSWLSTGSYGISHHGFGQQMIGGGTTYDMTPINTWPYRNYTSFYPPKTPMNVGYWSAGSFSDLAWQQMYWQQHMRHQLAHYTSPYWPTYGHAQSDVFSTEALNLTKPGTTGSE
ncbi:hypothetical protein DPMN_176623 [Dreissena polymorpha]|uniref:Fork-head domain-containing protein n=1 Tax=Dreissena polymorpha TaxID=45954 RepID=A0A9D4E788_DREPO|nr:hypothetical protein DPMN_176623 [Dreissena polymorpha]